MIPSRNFWLRKSLRTWSCPSPFRLIFLLTPSPLRNLRSLSFLNLRFPKPFWFLLLRNPRRLHLRQLFRLPLVRPLFLRLRRPFLHRPLFLRLRRPFLYRRLFLRRRPRLQGLYQHPRLPFKLRLPRRFRHRRLLPRRRLNRQGLFGPLNRRGPLSLPGNRSRRLLPRFPIPLLADLPLSLHQW
jgi:hypothetical protein